MDDTCIGRTTEGIVPPPGGGYKFFTRFGFFRPGSLFPSEWAGGGYPRFGQLPQSMGQLRQSSPPSQFPSPQPGAHEPQSMKQLAQSSPIQLSQ
jgi:hypothetical protein